MKTSGLRRVALGAFTSVLFSSMGHAEIYKWVDAKGQTHYTERKADAGGARTEELKVSPPPDTSNTFTPPTSDWRPRDRSGLPTSTQSPWPPGPPERKGPKAVSDGIDHGTNASRCALARDILSGARARRNKPTDAYDREVARNDVKAFCNAR
ncbi:MAG: DUF4124 domain-containing protein [Pseudomonadota bacterium]